MPARLHVNVDHVATIRQQRHTRYPDPVIAAGLAELAGAHGITIHLREDRRHIQERDVRILKETVQTHLNFEMAMTQEMREIALSTKPDTVTLVPERREELTTEGGFNVLKVKGILPAYLEPMQAQEIRCALFVDPDPVQLNAAKEVGIQVVELSTANYVEAEGYAEQQTEFRRLVKAAELADSLGMEVAAGHGLDYTNVEKVAKIPQIVEFNIGHAIVARAIFVGFEEAVREMKTLLGW